MFWIIARYLARRSMNSLDSQSTFWYFFWNAGDGVTDFSWPRMHCVKPLGSLSNAS